MTKGKRKLTITWAMAIIMILNVLSPLSTASAADIDKSMLTNLSATITQDGTAIPEEGTITSTKPIAVKISFGVPVDGDDPTPTNPVKKGDKVKFDLSRGFKLTSGGPIELKMGDLLVGTATFTTDPITKMVTATVTFDGDDSVFDGTSNTVRCEFEANFEYDGSGEDGNTGNHIVTILEKSYTVNVPALPIEYSVTKTGTANLADKSITWTVGINAKQGGTLVNLDGYQFFDDLQAVGTYIPSSFKVDGEVVSPTDTANNTLRYIFPSGSTSPKTITFKTEISDNAYYATSQQKVTNKAQLLNSESVKVNEGQFDVKFTPKWIEKTGVSSDAGSTGIYDPANRTITWTITANHMGATLNNVVITDLLPTELTLKSANWQAWTSTDWGIATPIEPNAEGEYAIGNINSKILLTIVTSVPDEAYTTGAKTYTNSAKIKWNGLPGTGLGTGGIKVEVGYNAISKTGVVDTANQKVRWTVNVDTKGQNIPDLKVYDLLVYGKSIDLSTVTGIPAGITPSDLTSQFGQKYAGNFLGSYTVKEFAIMQGATQVADLIEITGLSTSAENTFSFDSQAVDPNIFAGNTTSTVYNTATLFSASAKLNSATGSVNYTNKMLLKEMLKRDAISDPAAGVNDKITSNAQEGFDYQDKSAIFRLSVNADGLDLTKMKNAAGEILGAATLTDTLPDGWEFVDITSGSKYLIFEGEKQPNGTILAKDTTPDAVAGLTTNISGCTTTFTFTTLDKPYVILVKARLTSDTADEYFNSNKITTDRNNVTLNTEKWTTGVKSHQDVTIASQILDKTTAQPKAGELNWTVDYKPYDLSPPGEKLEDHLPIGIDLRTDARGGLLLEGNITANEMILNADGSYTVGNPVALVLGTNVSYNNATRILSFIIADSTKAYRFTYLTDITGELGAITNKVSLLGGSTEQEYTSKDYAISAMDGTASLLRNGWISIVKTGEAGVPLAGVEFTLYAMDGITVIKKGITGSDGSLKLKAIPDGEYILRETKAPEGYTLENVSHSLVVTTSGSMVTSSIDGKSGANSNVIVIKNFKEGIAGNLTISKVVAGNSADTTKIFDFTLILSGAPDTYAYIGNGVPGGTITSGDTISLSHGKSITIVGLPKSATYTVVEANYNGDGYKTVSTGATGSIVADATQTAAFTNTRNIRNPSPSTGDLTISKTVSGSNVDTTQKFAFTVTFSSASGSYHYTGIGVPNGTIKSGDTIFLAHGQSITISELPAGATYQVTEETSSAKGYSVESAGSSGTISSFQGRTAAFTNTKLPVSTGSLTISKTVVGQGADLTKKFVFTLTFIGAPDAYSYTGAATGTLRSGDTISLSSGESITIIDLPKDAKYTVTEADYTGAGYTTTSTGAVGTISVGTVQTAAFTNSHSNALVTPVTPKDPTDNIDEGDIPHGSMDGEKDGGKDGGKDSGKNGGKDGIPQTGDTQAGGLAKLGLLFFSVALMSLIATDFALRKKCFRQRNRK